MSILRMQPNTPTELALKYVHGVQKRGQYGLQFEYVTTSGQMLYLPPLAKEAIDSLRLEPGEGFTLTKRIAAGSAIAWDIERLPPPAPALPAQGPPLNGNGAKESEPSRRPITSASTSVYDQHSTPGLTTEESRRVYRQLVAAIEAAQAAEKHSQTIGYPVKFRPEDIRALAISAFIQQSQNGRRAA